MTSQHGIEITVPSGELIVTKTNTEGVVTYGSRNFFALTGYSETELLGQFHQVLHHPDVPKAYYKLLVDLTTKNSHEFFGIYKALTKQGNFYWSFVHVTPSYNSRCTLLGFQSITRPAKPELVAQFGEWYREMRTIEQTQSASKSAQFLFEKIAEKGMNYNEFVFSYQA